MIPLILEWFGAASMIVTAAGCALVVLDLAHGESEERSLNEDLFETRHEHAVILGRAFHPLHHPLEYATLNELIPTVCEVDP